PDTFRRVGRRQRTRGSSGGSTNEGRRGFLPVRVPLRPRAGRSRCSSAAQDDEADTIRIYPPHARSETPPPDQEEPQILKVPQSLRGHAAAEAISWARAVYTYSRSAGDTPRARARRSSVSTLGTCRPLSILEILGRRIPERFASS